MLKFFSSRYRQSADSDQPRQRGFVTKAFTHITRNWSLAKRLEHIRNRGKEGRGRAPKES